VDPTNEGAADAGLPPAISPFQIMRAEIVGRYAIDNIIPVLRNRALHHAISPWNMFHGAWTLAFFIFLAVCLLWKGKSPKWVLDYQTECPKQFGLIRLATLACVISAVIGFFLMIVLLRSREFVFHSSTLSVIGTSLIGLMTTFTISFVLGAYCKVAEVALNGDRLPVKGVLSAGLISLPSIFALLLTSTLGLTVVYEILTHFPQCDTAILNTVVFYVVSVLVCSLPFLIVERHLEINDLASASIQFLRENIIGVIQMLISGLVLYFVVDYIDSIMTFIIRPQSLVRLDFDVLKYAVRAFIGAWYFVSFTDWIRQSSATIQNTSSLGSH
jgi:hypothetical protein